MVALLAYWNGVWHFAFKNWVISREMPPILVQAGFLEQNQLACICIPPMRERGYSIMYVSIAGLISLIQVYSVSIQIAVNCELTKWQIFN